MTQKPPEKEIWAISREERQTYARISCSTLNHGREGYPRYILAAPKEDVERALDDMDELFKDKNPAFNVAHHLQARFLSKHIETIRRVLMANAGRGE